MGGREENGRKRGHATPGMGWEGDMTKVLRRRTEKVNSARPLSLPSLPSSPWDLDSVVEGKLIKRDVASKSDDSRSSVDNDKARWFFS